MVAGTEAQPDLIARAKEIVAAHIEPQAAATDRERTYPEGGLAKLAEAGLMGLLIPSTHGGRGAGLLELALVAEEVAAGCATTAMCFLMHNCGCALMSARATPDQAREWLGPLASGSALTTLAFSERGSGAHFYAPGISAIRDNGSLTLSGQKHFVTSGGQATHYPVLVNASGGSGLTAVVVPADLPGVSFSGTWDGIGMSGNSSIRLELNNVTVAQANVLGEEGDGQDLVFGVVAPTFLVGLAAVNVGIGRAALEAAAAHVSHRSYDSGQTLSEVPAIQRYIGEMSVSVESARQLTRAAASAADSGAPEALPMIMQAKIASTESAMQVTATAMQVGGGQAYSRQVSLERHWRDARAGSVMAPTNDVLKEWLGKLAMGLPLFSGGEG